MNKYSIEEKNSIYNVYKIVDGKKVIIASTNDLKEAENIRNKHNNKIFE